MTRTGTPQRPLTDEERAHNEEVRRRAREKRDVALRAQEEAGRRDERPEGGRPDSTPPPVAG